MNGLQATNADISGKVTATSGSFSGSLNVPADDGTFTYAKANNFGLYMDSSTAFQSGRNDYHYGYTSRGAILHIEQYGSSKSFRGIYCNGEVEFQGVTQLLRTTNNQNDDTVDALIVEGINNKKRLINNGVVTLNNDVMFNGIYKRIKNSTFSLPSSPFNGQTYIVKGLGGAYVFATNYPIYHGDSASVCVNANASWNIGGETALLIFDSTEQAWMMLFSA